MLIKNGRLVGKRETIFSTAQKVKMDENALTPAEDESICTKTIQTQLQTHQRLDSVLMKDECKFPAQLFLMV